MTFRTLAVLTLGLLLAVPAIAEEPDGAALFENGKALLAKGDLEGAYLAYVSAVKADPANAQYSREALVLKSVLKTRRQVKAAEPSPQWARAVLSLHVWFLRNDLVDAAIELDREAHAKAELPQTATLLGEALVEAKRDAEAATVLASTPEADRGLDQWTFLGIALARQGRTDEAKKALGRCEVPADAGVSPRLELARLHVLLGDADAGVESLKAAFEKTPPSMLADVKSWTRKCPDMASLRGTPAFVKVLETESKVEESGCSGGSGCGSCPSRGGCGGGEEKPAEGDGEKECGGCGKDG